MSRGTVYRPRHSQQQHRGSAVYRRQAAWSVVLAAAITTGLGTAPAWAVPEQGGTSSPGAQSGQGGTSSPGADSDQGGTSSPTTPDQGGTTPAPQPQTQVVPGNPGLVPAPPSAPSEVPSVQAPSTPQSYPTPYPHGVPDIRSGPRPAPVQPRREWKPDTLTAGNLEIPVKDLPVEIQRNPKAIVSFNDWAAYAESEIARGLISMGVPKDEASRRAAAIILGAIAGGAAGGAVTFTATALIVGAVTIPLVTAIGAGIGAGVGTVVPGPPPPLNTLGGMAAGAGIGAGASIAFTLFIASLMGFAGMVAGAAVGGLIADALGAGDPGANRKRPDLPWTPSPNDPAKVVPPLPNPDGNQFELHVDAAQAPAGVPAVDYVVTQRGDVTISANLGGQNIGVGWTAEQAQGPINALGPLAPAAEKSINGATRALTDAAKALPGVEVDWPQLKAPAPAAAR